MTRLQTLMVERKKRPVTRPQPKSLFSTGAELDRDEVIREREIRKRGITSKNACWENRLSDDYESWITIDLTHYIFILFLYIQDRKSVV